MTLLSISQDPIIEENLHQAVAQLSKSSIEIAEAAANYGALKVIFGVFMVIVLLVLVSFIYQTYSLTSKINSISIAAKKTQDYFEEAESRNIGTTEGQIIIRRSLNSVAVAVKYYILRIKLENHIDNVEAVKSKIRNLVKNEYAEINSYLSNFTCNERSLNEVIDEDDLLELGSIMLEQVYIPKSEFSVFLMDQAIDIYVNGIKLTYLKNV